MNPNIVMHSHAASVRRRATLTCPVVGRFVLALALLVPALARGQVTPANPTINVSAPWTAASIDTSSPRSLGHRARLANLSIRATTGMGQDTLIAGAVVRGSGSLPMLVRAVGPGLANFGVANFVRDPHLRIFQGQEVAAQTNTFAPPVAAASAFVGAFPLRESAGGSAGDAAMIGQPFAGTITAHCTSATGASGVALLEFYDASANAATEGARFVNFSARGNVGTGENTLVVGFVVTGEGTTRLLLRGVGASLSFLSSVQMLEDPAIELFSGNVRIAANDNWADDGAATRTALLDAQAATGAFALTGAADASLLVTLPAGAYTLHVRAARGQGAVALAEIYEVPTGEFDAAYATNAVGLELYRELARTAGAGVENLALSPYSIESALALAYAGAAGQTREEMASVLRFPADNAALQTGFATLRRALEDAAAESQAVAQARTAAGAPTDAIAWNAANRLFGQHDFAFRESFLTLMRDGFAAPFAAVDFNRETEVARLTINRWVEEQTREKIRDLIPRGGVTPDTRLALVNALYLKAPWDAPFPKANTAPRPFRTAAGDVRNVSTMQTTTLLRHAVEPGLTVVAVDYLGGSLQFLIMLPDEGRSVDDVAASLTPAHLARWANLQRRQVALSLPRFKIEGATIALSDALKALGMRSAFDVPAGSANFDGIAPRRPTEYLAISDVFHQTFIELDEEGTEAAAATAVVVGVVSAPPRPVEVRVDRPFLFAIQHRTTGACLFLGRITNPQ